MYFNKSFTPAAASLTGFASNVTGATWALSATSSADSLAHQVTIRNDSATDHSAKTAVLTGTDADGNAQTETLNLPGNGATVTSTKFYLTLTSVVPSATINADTMDIGWAATSVSQSIGLEKYSVATAAISVDISGTINYDIEESVHDLYDTPQQNGAWFNHASIVGDTTDQSGSSTQSMRCLRLAVNSLNAGATARVTVAQAVSP
jgi:hypothetical protein